MESVVQSQWLRLDQGQWLGLDQDKVSHGKHCGVAWYYSLNNVEYFTALHC